jgi:hypothetical protein
MSGRDKLSVQHWGYSCVSDEQARGLVWPVRFKPAVTLVLTALGLVFRQPFLLLAVGLLGIFGTAFPRFSWIDWIYNQVVAPWTGAPRMGPDPSLRRMACGMADFCIFLSGLGVLFEKTAVAWGFGGVVLVLSLSVVLTGICLPVYGLYRWRNRQS